MKWRGLSQLFVAAREMEKVPKTLCPFQTVHCLCVIIALEPAFHFTSGEHYEGRTKYFDTRVAQIFVTEGITICEGSS